MEATRFFDSFDKTALPRLRAYFGSVRSGQDEVIRTTFAQEVPVIDTIMQWLDVLNKISSTMSPLYEYEIDQAKKVGPMSVRLPLTERMSDIESYYSPTTCEATEISRDAINAVLREWTGVSGLRLRGQDRTVENMKLSTNSGSPFFTRRSACVASTVPLVSVTYDARNGIVYQSLPHGDYEAVAVLGWRGQEGGPNPTDVKQRVVWMFPFAINICELQLYQPLIAAAQRHELVPAWVSDELVDDSVTRLFDTKPSGDDVVCTDFEHFDQSIRPQLWESARTILTQLTFRADDWLNNIFPIKYGIPLAIDYGTLLTGPHGMASGSGGTNVDETLIHRALQYEAAQRSGQNLNPYSQCLGDDGMLTYPGITADKVMRSYSSHGLTMNASKQYVSSNDCIYLRRWHSQRWRLGGKMVGVYPTCRALGRMLFQERYYTGWNAVQVALRQLSILENVKNHPLREEFAEFCMKRDKYRLGLDIPDFFSKVEQFEKEIVDDMPDWMGWRKSTQNPSRRDEGISSWWITSYLRRRQGKNPER